MTGLLSINSEGEGDRVTSVRSADKGDDFGRDSGCTIVLEEVFVA